MVLNKKFWGGRKVLITGHTGFKGSWLVMLLNLLGSDVSGFSLPYVGGRSLFVDASVGGICRDYRGDIRDYTAVLGALNAERPQIIFHLAAQTIVTRGYTDPLDTLSSNIMGTATLLEAVRSYGQAAAVIVVTTDKVYRDTDGGVAYSESAPLGGNDPYGASKACAELVAECYRDRYLRPIGTRVATVRAGNVIGGGDWGEARLIPDIVRAWASKEPFVVRNPGHVRPWQYVLEVLTGYLLLAECLSQGQAPEGAYNFGPSGGDAVDVVRVVSRAVKLLSLDVEFGGEMDKGREVALLRIDSTKARDLLGFENVLSVDESIDETLRWYRIAVQDADQLVLCRQFINDYWARVSLAVRQKGDGY